MDPGADAILGSVVGIDVLAFAVMSKHLHVVLRNRPARRRDDWLAPPELERKHAAEAARGAPLGRASHAERRQRRWMQGVSPARQVFV